MGFLDGLFGEEKRIEKKVEQTEKTAVTKTEAVPREVEEVTRSVSAKVIGTVKRTPGWFAFVTRDGKVMEQPPKKGGKRK